ncbi:hypothetical protein EJB05_29173, partial [Eragrostis curvula]
MRNRGNQQSASPLPSLFVPRLPQSAAWSPRTPAPLQFDHTAPSNKTKPQLLSLLPDPRTLRHFPRSLRLHSSQTHPRSRHGRHYLKLVAPPRPSTTAQARPRRSFSVTFSSSSPSTSTSPSTTSHGIEFSSSTTYAAQRRLFPAIPRRRVEPAVASPPFAADSPSLQIRLLVSSSSR